MHFYKPRQAGENKTGFVSCSPRSRLVSHTDTLYQPVRTGKKVGEMTQQIKIIFHTHQGVFMWNDTGRDVHDHYPLFKQ
jgi:hypothetical protein